jgi:steroid delta-isomerase
MTREEIERRLEEYRAALRSMEPDRWVGMFAEDAEVQDPVGGPVHRGEEQIRAFFASVKLRSKRLDMTPQATYVSPPNAAAVLWSLHASQHEGPDQLVEGVSTYDFRQDGKVSRMLVFGSTEPAWSREREGR